ncbi:MAG: DUF6259 domain-containing protein [Anaerolineae bacterium]|nr:DUF6259 domain-containing protein [Anaerolineae bacterium]
MATPVTFRDLTVHFWVMTTRDIFEPGDWQLAHTSDGLVARANRLTYGDHSGSVEGTIEVKFTHTGDGFTWQARAQAPGLIKGVKAAIAPLPLGKIMVPLGATVDLQEGDRGRVFSFPGGYYPRRHISGSRVEPRSGPIPIWSSPFAVLQTDDHTLCLQSREHPPRVKKLWIYRQADHQELRVYDEADAYRRSSDFTGSLWRLERVEDWRAAADDYSTWMAQAYGVTPFAERTDVVPWMKRIGLVVMMHGISHDGKILNTFEQMAERLERLAERYPPEGTLVELVAFEGRFDHSWPENAPAPELGGEAGSRRFFETARRLGFHVMPHLNVWGASFENPDHVKWLEHRILDGEGRPINWSYDFDQDEIDEEIFAYISPDVQAWRAELRRKIDEAVARGFDAIYLDQVGTFVNDLKHDHFRGLRVLYDELSVQFPGVQQTCEGPTTEGSLALCPVHLGVSINEDPEHVELYQRLYGPFIRQYWNNPSEPYRPANSAAGRDLGWSREGFLRYIALAEQANGLPTLNLCDYHIQLDTDLVKAVFDWARRYTQTLAGSPVVIS